MIKKIVMYIIVLLLFTNLVLGLGIRPAKKYFEFQPNEIMQGSFKIVNNDNKNLNLFIYTQGDLAEYINLQEENIQFSNEEKIFIYNIKMPSSISPDQNIGEIVISETIPNLEISGTQVTAKIKVIYKVIVKTPTPDKFIKANLDVVTKNKKVDFVATVQNIGLQNIDHIMSFLSITEGTRIIQNLETNKISLSQNEIKELTAKLDLEQTKLQHIKNGQYEVTASINYDNKIIELTKEFTIGEPQIIINYIDEFFVTDKINEFNIEFQNEWNKQRQNVYADFILFKGSKQVWSAKTVSFSIDPWSNKQISSFLDARDLEPGEYQLDIITYHEDKIDKDSKSISIMTESDYNKLSKQSPMSLTNILVIAFIILFITVIIMFIYTIKILKKRKNK